MTVVMTSNDLSFPTRPRSSRSTSIDKDRHPTSKHGVYEKQATCAIDMVYGRCDQVRGCSLISYSSDSWMRYFAEASPANFALTKYSKGR